MSVGKGLGEDIGSEALTIQKRSWKKYPTSHQWKTAHKGSVLTRYCMLEITLTSALSETRLSFTQTACISEAQVPNPVHFPRLRQVSYVKALYNLYKYRCSNIILNDHKAVQYTAMKFTVSKLIHWRFVISSQLGRDRWTVNKRNEERTKTGLNEWINAWMNDHSLWKNIQNKIDTLACQDHFWNSLISKLKMHTVKMTHSVSTNISSFEEYFGSHDN